MSDVAFNPLLAAVKTRQQSHEVAPEPIATKKLDTTTPAAPPSRPRRFDLGDLPKYEAELFPLLQQRFPHLNARMYGGWLRGCITDNACCFMCTDNPGGIIMAHMYQKPMNPVPLVEIDFVVGIGSYAAAPTLFAHVLKWASEIGAPTVEFTTMKHLENIKKAQSPYAEHVGTESRIVVRIKRD